MLRSVLVFLTSAPIVFCACPSGSTLGFTGKCYLPVSTPADFRNAEKYCERLGGNLVAIANAFENTQVANVTPFLQSWIGANILLTSQWAWTSQALFLYNNWFPGKPDNTDIWQCAVLKKTPGMYWSNTDCSYSLPFTCQFDPNAPTPTPMTTTPPPIPLNCLFMMDWSYFGEGQSADPGNKAKYEAQKTFISNVAQQLYNNNYLSFQASLGAYGDLDMDEALKNIDDQYISDFSAFLRMLSYWAPDTDYFLDLCDAIDSINGWTPILGTQCLIFISAEDASDFGSCSNIDSNKYPLIFGVELNGHTGISTQTSLLTTATDSYSQSDVDNLVNLITNTMLDSLTITTTRALPISPPVDLNCLLMMDWSYYGPGNSVNPTVNATYNNQKTYISKVAKQLYSNPRLEFKAGFGYYGDADNDHCGTDNGYYMDYSTFSSFLSSRQPGTKCYKSISAGMSQAASANINGQQCLIFISAENSFTKYGDFTGYQFIFGVELNGGTGVTVLTPNVTAISDSFPQTDVDKLVNLVISTVL